MSNPLVSIIIPTFNRAHLIGQTLDSIIAQTYENWECIVVDDGSTDNTAEVMAEYVKGNSRIQFHHRPPEHKPGGNGARNYGFKISRGEFVQWFDDDDLMHPDKIEKKLLALKGDNANFSVCNFGVFWEHPDKELIISEKTLISKNPFEDFVKRDIEIMTPSPLWRKNFLLKLPFLFDENLKASQEWDFYTRIFMVDSNYRIINEPLFYIRRHEKSIQNQNSLEPVWFRFQTRLALLNNKELQLSPEIKNYLSAYLIERHKDFLKHRNFRFSQKSFFSFILPDKEVSNKTKFYSTLTLMLYFSLGKGYRLINKIK